MRRDHDGKLRRKAALEVVLFTFALSAFVGAVGLGPQVLAGGDPLPGMSPPQILVGLFRAASASFTCEGSWTLTGPKGEEINLPPEATVALRPFGSGIAWETSGAGSEKGTLAGNARLSIGSPQDGPFIAVRSQGGASTSFEGKTFRGSMVIMAEGDQLLVANALDFEDYIQSVVGGEIPDSWPMEVNRAQAIAARSFAAYRTKLTPVEIRRDYEKAFGLLRPGDVLIWASDQVYRGICEETAATVEAASSTRGQILTYDGQPIAAYYHSDAGGMTEDPLYVWGGRSIPYLSAVSEEPHESPHASWTVDLSPAQLAAALRQLGLPVEGQPEAISGLQGGNSGRWISLTVRSSFEKVTVRGTDLRRVLPQVKSTLFSAYSVGGGKTTTGSLCSGLRYSVAASDGIHSGVRLAEATAVGRSGETASLGQGAAVVSGLKAEGPTAIVLEGAGWGHGVGLSQWGARGMALTGRDARSILMFYYPGTTSEQWW